MCKAESKDAANSQLIWGMLAEGSRGVNTPVHANEHNTEIIDKFKAPTTSIVILVLRS